MTFTQKNRANILPAFGAAYSHSINQKGALT